MASQPGAGSPVWSGWLWVAVVVRARPAAAAATGVSTLAGAGTRRVRSPTRWSRARQPGARDTVHPLVLVPRDQGAGVVGLKRVEVDETRGVVNVRRVRAELVPWLRPPGQDERVLPLGRSGAVGRDVAAAVVQSVEALIPQLSGHAPVRGGVRLSRAPERVQDG
jgi:hypothetical protein